MATELKLPDLGEGIEDVTINRWVVSEGASVNEGDIIVEVATDKVDTEVAAPVSGTLLKTNFGEGELVDIDAVLAFIGEAGEEVDASSSSAPAQADAPSPTPAPTESTTSTPPPAEAPEASEDGIKVTPVAKRVAVDKGVSLSGVSGTGPNGQITKQDVLNMATGASSMDALPGDLADIPSFIVRRLAAENGIDLEEIAQGRPLSTLTKYDVLSAVASREEGRTVVVEPRAVPAHALPSPATSTPTGSAEAKAATSASTTSSAPSTSQPAAASATTEGEELIKPTRMRQLIAKNTLESLQNTAQVTTMWDVDMSAVLAHRKANKGEFAAQGVKLTVTAYLMMGAIAGIRAVPAANSVWTDEGVLIKRYINLGMAAALPMDANGLGGLIVPVIKNAGDLNLIGMARAVNDMAGKARGNKLAATDLQGGTFTLSNYGTSGSRFQTPIITQPQVGILGVGATEKRAVVVSNGHPLEANTGDYLTFKPMTTLGFTYDHRVLDGATADAFCAAVKDALENWA
ncbi:MAG: dihydrolipoamide acetyltransferase family protein [Chloroflexota bacterium]